MRFINGGDINLLSFGKKQKKRVIEVLKNTASIIWGTRWNYLPGLGSLSRVFLAPLSRSRSRLKKKTGAGSAWKKSQEPEPLKNKPAPQPCEKIKRIKKLYFSYSSLGKIFSFMVKKTIILLVLYFIVLPY